MAPWQRGAKAKQKDKPIWGEEEEEKRHAVEHHARAATETAVSISVRGSTLPFRLRLADCLLLPVVQSGSAVLKRMGQSRNGQETRGKLACDAGSLYFARAVPLPGLLLYCIMII